MKIGIVFFSVLLVFACSTSKNTTPAASKASEQSYQINLTRALLAKPPAIFSSEGGVPSDEFTAFSAWVAKYPQMAEVAILSGFFKEGNCEIAIQDANKDGRYDGINKDFIHLLRPKADFSEWSDLNSNSILLKELNYFKVNNTYYSAKVVESNGPALIIKAVDTVSIDRCMFYPDEVPAMRIELQEIETKRVFSLNDILSEKKKQFTVINFWATYCEPCIREIPTLNEIGNYANMVAICGNANDYDGNIVDFIKEKNIKGTHCYSTRNLERLFCQDRFPFFVVLDEQGSIIAQPENAHEALIYLKKG
jgi:AhpC/TSA family